MHAAEAQDSGVLPVRRHGPPRRDPSPTAPLVAQLPYDAAAMQTTLREIQDHLDHITGLLVTTRDGLLLCADSNGTENDSVAAMSAAAMGLATQFTGHAQLGEPQGAVFEGERGYVCVFPVERPLLLVVLGQQDVAMGLFNIAAKQALSLLRQAIVRHRVHSFRATRRAYFEQNDTD